MSELSLSPPLDQAPRAFTDAQIFFNLIRQEWRLCQGPVIALAMLWVSGLWVLVIFNHPAWLLAIGVLFVMLVAPSQAGRDVLDGTEEFSFTQPPGRSPLYLARLAIGLAFLLANGLLGGAAIAGDLPQRLWSLCFSGGLTEPFAPGNSFLWYGLAVLVPAAAYGVTFAIAANSGTRAGVNIAWLGGIAAAGSVMGAGLLVESLLWRVPNGFLAFPALLVTAVLVALAGHQLYLRKEATGSGGVAGRDGRGGMIWLVALILGLLLMVFGSFFWLRTTAVRQVQEERLHAADQERAHAAEPPPVRSLPSPAPTPERNSN